MLENEVRKAKKEYRKFSFGQNKEIFDQEMSELLIKTNDKRFGKEIKAEDIILEAVSSFSDSQIQKLKYESMSVLEKVRLKFEESRTSKDETFDDYMARIHKIKVPTF